MVLNNPPFKFFYSMSDSQSKNRIQTVTNTVAELYNTYPFPPEPLTDEPPPGYNWRWSWNAAYNFCAGKLSDRTAVRILDAGCGTGCSTEYLVALNPGAEITAIDISPGALAVAKERCQRSVNGGATFKHLSLFDADQLEGEFDLINSVGVLHHTADPARGLKALADKLAPGGIMHIFVYGELGRQEITMMQEAIALLQGDQRGDFKDGVAIGRQIFASLPESNRLRKREEERWSLENGRDECFADMYVHPQEIDFNVRTLFEWIDGSGLAFVGFSNPSVWSLENLVSQNSEILDRAAQLSERDRYRLTELLNPSAMTHFEFFLSKGKLNPPNWQDDDVLSAAKATRSSCMDGWPSPTLFNFEYQVIKLSDAMLAFLTAADGTKTISELTESTGITLDEVRDLQLKQMVWLK
jgi:2-polyprenyl-3-methyl-5-hydroxy-6-metoxy-1,4-benzoquinol methylase